ncbi:peptidoglycan-binding protein [Calothrix sp. NIES-3974]|uniref:peptidoglycan-binding protein n=1 Tax=Calothrix sp. NIES-3974 TaxID=2005462 RepID=UPI000B6154F9|nr:peptidoglycan-binding protein [Calothrix sp. NIES-3974]BAZ06632.1 hypothetical protein NIES3974_32940 [Calothrix sp. NIES-3974]
MQRCPSFLLVLTALSWHWAFPSRVAALVFFPTNPIIELAQEEVGESQIVPTAIPTPSSNERILRLGDTGEAVKRLQTQLQQLGYYAGKIDGEYGISTRLAVARFQAAKGLSSDGVVGATTRMQIEAEIQARAAVVGTKPEPETPRQNQSRGRGILWWVFAGMGIVGCGGAVVFATRKFIPKKPESDPTVITPDEAIAIDGTKDIIDIASAVETENQSSHQQNYHGSENTRTDYTPVGNYGQTFIQTNGHYSPVADHEQTLIQTNQHYSLVPDPEQTLIQTNIEVEPWERHAHEQKFLPPEISGRIAKVNIIDEMVKDLRSPDPNKRRKAIWDLGQQGDSRAIQPLVDLLVDADSQQRSLILGALSEIGVRTLKPMNRALAISLQDESPEVRQNAIRDLTRVYDLMAQLSQMLCHAVEDPDTNVQATARYALSQFNRLRTLANSEVNRNDNPPL